VETESLANTRGVKKNRGTGKPENWETRNRETGVPVLVPVWENQKRGTPVPVSSFWYPVFTRLSGTRLNIYFLYFRYIFLVRALHICKENLLVSLHHT
jgi:hypothetical protein